MKYIKNHSQVINESIGRGSVVLIKGKPIGGKCRLFATHILGYAEVKAGAVMLFLSDDFYRIKEVDNRLKAVKIGYRDYDDLKAVLNFKSPGRISVVRNNNKTPLHWKTLKHQVIHTALHEIEGELKFGEYIFENENVSVLDKWDDVYNQVVKRLMNTLFFNKKELDILEYYFLDGENRVDKAINNADGSTASTDWDITFRVMIRDAEIKKKLESFQIFGSFEIGLTFDTDVELEHDTDSGDYWTPPSYSVDIKNVETDLSYIFIEGTDGEFNKELKKMISNAIPIFKEFTDSDFESYVEKITKKHIAFIKKGE